MLNKIKLAIIITATAALFNQPPAWGALDLQKDASGWTIFTPTSSGDYASRIVYVDPDDEDAGGTVYSAASFADPFQPSSTPDAYQTYAAAYTQTRSGYPDWILIKRGSVLYEAIGTQVRSGKDSDEPFLIGAYGASGLSPVFKTSSGVSAVSPNAHMANTAIVGIQFYAYTRNPADPGYSSAATANGLDFLVGESSGTDLHFEGVAFRFYHVNVAQCYGSCSGMETKFYRCLFLNSYNNSGGQSHGLFSARTKITIDECVFDHCGWYSSEFGPASMFQHSLYVGENPEISIQDSVFSRDSSGAVKVVSYEEDLDNPTDKIDIINNLLIDNEWGISISYNNEVGIGPRIYSNVTVSGNVQTNAGQSNPTGRGLGWGFNFGEINTGLIHNNLVMNQPESYVTNVYGIEVQLTNRNLTVSDNVIHNLRNGIGFTFPSNGSDISGAVFSGNRVNIATNAGYIIESDYATTGKWTFSGNQYYSNVSDGHRFYLSDADVTNAQWTLATGDDFTWGEISFPNAARTIETYMDSLSRTATIDAYIAALRAQDRYDWDDAVMPAAVNNYLRAGFDMELVGDDPTKPHTATPGADGPVQFSAFGTGPNSIVVTE